MHRYFDSFSEARELAEAVGNRAVVTSPPGDFPGPGYWVIPIDDVKEYMDSNRCTHLRLVCARQKNAS